MIRTFFSWPSLICLTSVVSLTIAHVMQIGSEVASNHYPREQYTHLPDTTASPDEPTYINATLTGSNVLQSDQETNLALGPSPCTPQVSANPTIAAQVRITVSSKCPKSQLVTIHHNGLIITETVSSVEPSSFVVPALSEHAVFVLDFEDGTVAVTSTRVASLKFYDRGVVQWAGSTELTVRPNHSGNPTDAAMGKRAWTSRFGQAHHNQAIISTSAFGDTHQTPHFEVHAMTKGDICERAFSFQSINVTAAGAIAVQEYDSSPAICTDGPEMVLLKTISRPITLALNY